MHQIPNEFVKRIHSQFSDEADAFLSAIQNMAEVSVRQNPDKQPVEFSIDSTVQWCSMGSYLKEKPAYTLDPLFHAGAYFPQEASSMFLWHVLSHVYEKNSEANLRVLDLCGAPGGKSTMLATFFKNSGLVVANEVIKPRSKILRENIIKWGLPNVVVTNNDPADFSPLTNYFDLLVVDAPCSGEGMFRKDATAIDEWSVANTNLCARRQQRILKDAWPALKPGGILIYSTCTYNPEENETNLQWLQEQEDVAFLDIPLGHNWGVTRLKHKEVIAYGFYPHRVRGEGFFISVIRKLGDEVSVAHRSKSRKKHQAMTKVVFSEKWLIHPDRFKLLEEDKKISAIPVSYFEEFMHLKRHLKLIHAGVPLGMPTRKEVVPDHALAMSVCMRPDAFERVELDQRGALRYLKGVWDERFKLSERKWYIASFRNQSLGFIKSMESRVNNYYPKEWRIRMELPDNVMNSMKR
jgi:16S rRNA C967 or C1407 C5-methylase (RsmB/RsmF family)/NOL1/NOP2/fmu family ribosome biogenesis protein